MSASADRNLCNVHPNITKNSGKKILLLMTKKTKHSAAVSIEKKFKRLTH